MGLSRVVGLGSDCVTYHSLYWSFQRAIQPSGTLGGGGPDGASKSAMIVCV